MIVILQQRKDLRNLLLVIIQRFEFDLIDLAIHWPKFGSSDELNL